MRASHATLHCEHRVDAEWIVKMKFTENDLEIRSAVGGPQTYDGENFTTFKLFNKLMHLMDKCGTQKPHKKQIVNDFDYV